MPEKEHHASEFMRQLPFFKGLPDLDLTGLLEASSVKDYAKGAPLFHQGDKADRFFVILHGWIKLYRITSEGDEAIVALFTRSDVFGEAAALGGAGYPFSAQAAEQTRLIEIPAAVIREKAKSNSDIMARVMDSMSREMHKLQMENEHMALMSAPQRVGCLLLQLSSGMAGAGGIFPFPYDKSLAAARLGMKPETFSRTLAQLKSLGVTARNAEISIESFQCLAAYCCGNCSADIADCKGAGRKTCDKLTCPAQKAQTGTV